MTKKANIIFELDQAWEEWTFEVPDDADEAWIRDNINELWTKGAAICMNDSGNNGNIVVARVDVEVEEEQPQVIL